MAIVNYNRCSFQTFGLFLTHLYNIHQLKSYRLINHVVFFHSSKTTGSAGKSKRARPSSDSSRHVKSSNDSGEKRITSSSGFLLFYQHRKQDVQDVITKVK